MVVCGYAKRAETEFLSEMFQRKVLKQVGGKSEATWLFVGLRNEQKLISWLKCFN